MSAPNPPTSAAGRPVPLPNPVSEPFWEGCRRGQFLLQRCTSCAATQFYPRTVCSACGGGLKEDARVASSSESSAETE